MSLLLHCQYINAGYMNKPKETKSYLLYYYPGVKAQFLRKKKNPVETVAEQKVSVRQALTPDYMQTQQCNCAGIPFFCLQTRIE